MVVDPRKSEELSSTVRRFIERHIESVEQLEVLLLLYRDTSRYWDAPRVAQSLHLGERHAAALLERLGQRGFFDVRITSSVVYRFGPATLELGAEVGQVADGYRDHRAAVVGLLTPRRQSLKDFADAFRLKKDPDNG